MQIWGSSIPPPPLWFFSNSIIPSDIFIKLCLMCIPKWHMKQSGFRVGFLRSSRIPGWAKKEILICMVIGMVYYLTKIIISPENHLKLITDTICLFVEISKNRLFSLLNDWSTYQIKPNNSFNVKLSTLCMLGLRSGLNCEKHLNSQDFQDLIRSRLAAYQANQTKLDFQDFGLGTPP